MYVCITDNNKVKIMSWAYQGTLGQHSNSIIIDETYLPSKIYVSVNADTNCTIFDIDKVQQFVTNPSPPQCAIRIALIGRKERAQRASAALSWTS